MNKYDPKRRMVENEMVFRGYNESVQKQFDAVKTIADEDGQLEYGQLDDTPLFFYCECADENCQKRITMTPSAYARAHVRRDRFIILPSHETRKIERVVSEAQGYLIVEKFDMPEEASQHLHETNAQNV